MSQGPRKLASWPGLSQHRGQGHGNAPAAPRAPRSLRSGCGLQCAPLPDRDQHSSTPDAQQPANRRSNPATLPNTGGSPAKRVRPPSGSGNKENCNKKLTDSRQPWRRALACPPLPIWAAEATLAVGVWRRLRPRGAQHSHSTTPRVSGCENYNKILATPSYPSGIPPESSWFLCHFPSSCRVSLQPGRLNDSRTQRTTEPPAPRYKFL